jgi:transcriptional regulator with XRE-family HTH domain
MQMTKKESLAREIKIARATKGYTQTDLSNVSGVAKITIALIESKKNKKLPSIDTVVKLANALDLNKERLLKYLA